MQYSTLIHSNSQNNFNYNSIHPVYNVFPKNRPRQLHLGNLEVNRQIRFTWIRTDPPFHFLFQFVLKYSAFLKYCLMFLFIFWFAIRIPSHSMFFLRSSDEIGRPFCFRSVSYFYYYYYYSFSFSFFTAWIGSAISPLFFNRSPSNLVGK